MVQYGAVHGGNMVVAGVGGTICFPSKKLTLVGSMLAKAGKPKINFCPYYKLFLFQSYCDKSNTSRSLFARFGDAGNLFKLI